MTIDKERLRALAEAATGWSNCDKVWPHAEYDEISVLGAICEEGVQYPVAEIDADTYGDDGDSLKLAQFYAGANPAAVLALLAENAALAAEVERLRAIKSDLSNWGRLANRYMNEASGVISTIDPESETEGQEIHALQMALYDISIQWVSHSNAIDAAMADKGGATS